MLNKVEVRVECGLFWVTIEETKQPRWRWQYIPERRVPLQHVAVEACLVETTSEVKIVQKYYNPNSYPIEAIYVFPLDERAAVNEFEAEIQGKKLIGLVKEKEQAKAEYNAAVSRGDGAYLLEQEKADIFRARVGNIPPHTEVSISIKYVAEMKNELEKVRFVLPTNVAPRYHGSNGSHYWWNPSPSSSSSSSNVSPSTGMSLSLTCVCLEGFDSIESPSHSITTAINGHIASVGVAGGLNGLEKDFVLVVGYGKPHEPKVVIEEEVSGKGTYAAMLTLFPHLEFADVKTELIFVVDRSGSMEDKIPELREAMSLFMRSLPVDCFFNIVGFGSSYASMLTSSERYDDKSLKKATQYISKLSADMGGTELYQPLEHVFSRPLIPGYARQVFVLTDGQISQPEAVFELVKRNNTKARVFALGIGNSVSHLLVEGIARAGKGTSAFALENERIERKVMKQLKDAIQPALNQVKVDWGVSNPIVQAAPAASAPVGSKVLSLLNYVSPNAPAAAPLSKVFFEQAPFQVPSIYSDNHFRIYCIFSAPKLPEKVTIEAQSPDGLLKVELPVNPERIIKGNLIHTLAARNLIRDLEEGTSQFHSRNGSSPSSHLVRNEIVRLGTTYNLASGHTSFVAIERRGTTEEVRDWGTFSQDDEAVEEAAELKAASPRKGGILNSLSSFGSSLSKKKSKSSAPGPMLFSAPAPAAPAHKGAMRERQSAVMVQEEEDEEAEEAEEADDFHAHDKVSAPPPMRRSSASASASAPPPPPASAPFPPRSNSLAVPPTFPAPPSPSSPASLTSSSSSNYTKLSRIISFQGAQGSFSFEKELISLLGLEFSIISNQLSTLPSLSSIADQSLRQSLFATALVVAYLRKQLKELEEDWEMVEMKAKRWMASLKLPQLLEITNAAAASLI